MYSKFFKTFLPALLSLAILTSATPAPLPRGDISEIASPASGTVSGSIESLRKRSPGIGGLYMCKDHNWQGECFYIKVPRMAECWDLLDNWKNVITSFGPGAVANKFDEFHCTIFREPNCKGSSAFLKYPGTSDLTNWGMNDKGQSIICNWEDQKAHGLGIGT
ncbi:hypothetical protein K469DRAFT_604852 [Zopfia rhizophila CBS 207.26]|uniref:Ecp2 effector protein domain-containing protein n=1 Tax=Zopfia rhizophila CBS 207.26 TaxID=1314779 RepID=A0A6A6DC74_9PEZI|nr:hypothetical protein K469DRAFT_604852 [Zopfia rhizophila CBS 207.26]